MIKLPDIHKYLITIPLRSFKVYTDVNRFKEITMNF